MGIKWNVVSIDAVNISKKGRLLDKKHRTWQETVKYPIVLLTQVNPCIMVP